MHLHLASVVDLGVSHFSGTLCNAKILCPPPRILCSILNNSCGVHWGAPEAPCPVWPNQSHSPNSTSVWPGLSPFICLEARFEPFKEWREILFYCTVCLIYSICPLEVVSNRWLFKLFWGNIPLGYSALLGSLWPNVCQIVLLGFPFYSRAWIFIPLIDVSFSVEHNMLAF